ncbi:polyphosphate kinase 2 family protein [Acidimicrobiia bacterium EGI L10123]|uniref:polyphosphate kinase 2 family protein n=1 Tax=Salinilacustrithrix flava TaxID=2957203 RepID=UPI003D7C21F4|nr:polyphosphate kinase 2 family protein [Acidimicrobiia bacterium EGI L10123]
MQELLRVAPGTGLDLSAIDPRSTPGFDGGKSEGKSLLHERRTHLADLQDLLYADGTQRLLIVLQAMDTGGKDGTIRHVFRKVDPIGVHMWGFKKPSTAELARDYLWRVHARVPADGEVVVFNRSHYEDVLVVRVHGLIDDEQAERRLAHISDFERMLAEEGTTIVKLFLHISKEEQAERLRSRLERPDKHWKFSSADVAERAHWDRYQGVYRDAIASTSTEDAPWYVVPADRKWYRNLAISTILVETLEGLGMSYPEPEEGLEDIVID